MAAEAAAAPPPVQLGGAALHQPGRLERMLGPESYRLVRGLVTNPLSVAGIALLAMFVVVALAAPVLAPPVRKNANPYTIPRDGFSPQPKPPGTLWKVNAPPVPGWYRTLTGNDKWVHLMGTTSGQYDIFYGIVWGTRTALFVGITVVLSTLIIGMLVGSLSAFYGGPLDDVLQRITEVFMAFPFLLAALTLAAILTPKLGKGIWPALVALIAFGWMTYARVIRGDILTVKERDYVLAGRVLGAKDSRLLRKHIIPNAVFSTLVLASLDVGAVVLTFAALSFLGVGTEVGFADWGQLISFARSFILSLDKYWYIIVFPGLALLLFGLAWNLVGDALRDILDPKLRGKQG